MRRPNLSFIIPAKNEEGSVNSLYSLIVKEVKKYHKSYEIIFIDDGSTDKTFQIFTKLHKKDKRVKVIRFRGNFGKSIALQAGFMHAIGDIIFTMDADLQDDPHEIKRFLDKIDDGYDLVSGWKKKRYDPPSKVIPSRIFNYAVSRLTGVHVHDTNCGFKAYRKSVIDNINLYGELYRFIPVIAAKQNFKFTEIVVSHHPRKFGKTKFGWERNIKGFLDLITITFLTGFMRRPGHFFGMLGLLSFAGGFGIGIYVTYLRVTTGTIQFHYPLLFLGMLLMIIGVQFVSTGLMSEMILAQTYDKNTISRYITEVLE